MEGSTSVLAWYACVSCGALWSARIRGGNPTDPIAIAVVAEDEQEPT